MRYVFDGVEISCRLYNALRMEDLNTWEQAAKLSDIDVLRIPNVGRVALAEFKGVLERLRLIQHPKEIPLRAQYSSVEVKFFCPHCGYRIKSLRVKS